MALAILAFDAYMDNPDRTPANPNCLVKGDAFRIIDHDLAFRIGQKLFPPPEPWKPGSLQWLTRPGGHIFGAGLKGGNSDLSPVLAAWSGLSDQRLQACRAMLPSAWVEAVPAIEAALNHLRAVRDRIDDCLAELERSLT